MKFYSIGNDWSDHNCDSFIDKMKAEAEARPEHTILGMCGAWSVCFSIAPVVGKIFSVRAKRSTKGRDWHILGRMAKRIGAPEQEIDGTIEKDPSLAHYWVWDNVVPLDVIKEKIGLVRGTISSGFSGGGQPN